MREHPPHPLDALWQAPAIIWVLLAGECLAGILALAPGMSGSRWIYFGLASLVVQWVALLTLGTLYLTRNLLTGLRPLRLAWLAVGMLLVNTWLVAWLAWWLMGDAWPVAADGWPALVARLTGIALAVGFLGLAAFQNHWRGRLHAVRAKQSELQALQARIRPHFLFNTLNTGAALAGPRQILLEDELSLARRYLEIEALRFGERLQVRWELPRVLPGVTVPALSIQPLVENAIRHGAERMTRGDVEVAVSTTPDTVVVRISNPLPEAGGTAVPGHRVGLNASQVRIEALTGGRGSVRTETIGGRYVATVRLPVGPA